MTNGLTCDHVVLDPQDQDCWNAAAPVIMIVCLLASRGHGQGGKGVPTMPTRVATHTLDLHE